MSIYPDKRDGKPTGRWQIEVQRGKKTLRDRADTHEKAKEIEREFIARLRGDTLELDQRYVGKQTDRILDLIKESERYLWHGQAAQRDNFKKLRHAAELIGDRPVDTITTKTIDDLILKLRQSGPKGRPLSNATINRYLSAVSKFLKWAIEHDYRREPMPTLHWAEEDEGRIRWIEPDEEKKLCELLPDPYDTIVRVAIRTGMRKSEIYETVAGVDAQIDKHHVRLWKTKNRKARSIPISEETRSDLMYLREVGMPTERQLRYEWDKAKTDMGLSKDEDFVFHCCRHTFCTRLVQAGVDIRTIMELAGHKSIQTTIRYAHVSNDTLVQAVTKVASHFG